MRNIDKLREVLTNDKLVEITWKDEDNLWYLVRPFEEGEEPTEYLFKEESAYDIIEGTVKIIEHKKEEK